MRPVRLNTFNPTRYQTILDSLNDLVVVLDHNYKITYANKGFMASKISIGSDLICELFENACPRKQKSIKYQTNQTNYQVSLSYLPNQEGVVVIFSADQDLIKHTIKTASHDFKTPLTSLKLQAQLMKRTFAAGRSALCAKKVQSMLDLTEKQTNRLNELIEDMLRKSGI